MSNASDHSSALLTPPRLVLALGTLLVLGACQSPAEESADGAESTRSVSTAFRAEASRLMGDVAWLADDARYGRRAGTPGEDAARDYIVERFEKLGLLPAGEVGYLQAFEVPLPARDLGGSTFATGELNLSGADVAPLFCSSGGAAEGALAWVGYGIVDEEAGRDDYVGLDVEGKLVLVARGAPEFPIDPDAEVGEHSYGGPRTTFGNAGSVFTKVMNAKHRGAIGVILVQAPDKAEEALLTFDAAQEAKAGLPAVMIGVQAGEQLLSGRYGADLAEGISAQPDVLASISADVTRGMGQAENVLGLLQGKDHSRAVVIGAHYDHLGMGGTGSLSSRSVGEIHNGADDNASGTAATMELARLMVRDAEVGRVPECDVIFALWSGEELGLLGSAHFVNGLEGQGVVANVNMDMVGRADSGRLQVMGAGSSAAFAKWLPEAASRSGLDPVVTLSGHGIGGSDHQSFLSRGIPAVHLFTGVHTDYHKPSDDLEGFEAEGGAAVVEYARFITTQMTRAKQLDFIKFELAEQDDRPDRQRSWSSWFGSVPDYTSNGGGLLLSGVQEASPAERAGLMRGDIMVGAGSVEIDTIHDFVYALQLHKPGDVLRVRYLRGGEEQSVMLTLGSRELE